jgi:hypothetical protein
VNKRIVTLLYTALLVFALFYPFDFDFGTNHAQWLGYENGIRFKKKGMIISHEAPAGLYRKLTQGGGLALEVWVKSDDRMQDGPGSSHILSTTNRAISPWPSSRIVWSCVCEQWRPIPMV